MLIFKVLNSTAPRRQFVPVSHRLALQVPATGPFRLVERLEHFGGRIADESDLRASNLPADASPFILEQRENSNLF